jgi:phospholipid/cholesterol/gamma-HCH transport system ATP-binding protein
MIEAISLTKDFDSLKVLKGIDINFKGNEIVCILGESGKGKSVFLQILAGLIKPTSGSVIVEGMDITKLSEEELLLIRKRIGYLFQSGALYDFMNVYENLSFPLREHTKLSETEIKDKVDEMLTEVNLLDIKDKFPSELSGGMRKRASLARSVILGPKMLFCDEPTSGLDPSNAKLISQLILKLSRKCKSTTIITSHDIANSLSISDKVTVLLEGKLLDCGSPKDFLSSSDERVKDFLRPYKEVSYA